MDVFINIARDFTKTPGARHKMDGPFSGELFREQFLDKHFQDPNADYDITITLDGVEGYATSFLEEAFGGLGRAYGKERVLRRLHFASDEDESLKDEIGEYIRNCDRK